ncbi:MULTISPECIES: ATP-binding protein [Streptomyces]|uniref:ATP-binding protein n=1 Tax=Streptomyces TaxID=1883 RepID=UPI001F0D56C3|nr:MULTISPECIES: ATP-binding protein [Streptomyces]
MTLVTLPLAALVAWTLARRRRAAGVVGAWRMSLAEVGMVHGTVPFVWMILMPGAGAGTVPGRVSLIPLGDLITMGPLGIAGNLLVFAALGFFAPMRCAALASVPRVLALGAGCSVLVETAQYVLQLDRVSSVDDVIVNAVGAASAAWASRRWWRTTAQARAPLSRITAAARTAGNGSLSHRVRMEGRQDEFRELADTFDTMLGQLEAHVAEQRRFAANASHELRTPLAISQSLLDLARKDPARRNEDELFDRLHAVNIRSIALTEALLLLSRSDRGNLARESVDLSLIAEEAAENLLGLAEQRGITLDVIGAAARTSGSAELLLRMVTNLLQNAIVHNLPIAGTVTVHTETRNDTCLLRVENTGHPVPAELLPTLTEPFRRGTQRVRTDEHAGVGLGLAIVHSVVRAHDGALDLVARPAGGLLVTVRLPGTP